MSTPTQADAAAAAEFDTSAATAAEPTQPTAKTAAPVEAESDDDGSSESEADAAAAAKIAAAELAKSRTLILGMTPKEYRDLCNAQTAAAKIAQVEELSRQNPVVASIADENAALKKQLEELQAKLASK
jgi:methylphosphotriester-DNA--protein-cysteine methyltransferase